MSHGWVDLSRPVFDGMWVYPGDPEVSLRAVSAVPKDLAAVSELHLGTHTGTHVDAPAHVVPGGRTVDALEIAELCGEAYAARLSPDLTGRVDCAQLEHLPRNLPRRLCLALAGTDRASMQLSAKEPMAHPWLTRGAAEELWRRGVRLLGLDTPSPDASELPGPVRLPVHEFWLGNDGVIVENLAGVDRLVKFGHFELIVAPLLLAGGDGAPSRVFARIHREDALA